METSPVERNTRHFYDWEKLGRGWRVFNEPVHLEPEFFPFFTIERGEKPDDSKVPSILHLATTTLKNLVFKKEETISDATIEPLPVNAYIFNSDETLQVFTISFPAHYKLNQVVSEHLLTMLTSCSLPVSFEIVASTAFIRFQFVCRESDSAYLEGQLNAYYADCIVSRREADYLEVITDYPGAYVDFGLKEEFMRPIAMAGKSPLDPLQGLIGILEHLNEDETVVWQTIFQSTVNPWALSIVKSVTTDTGESFFLDAPEMPELAKEKVSSPLFAATTRILVQGHKQQEAFNLLKKISTTICNISQSDSNALIQLNVAGYDGNTMAEDILKRRSHRLGMLLNCRELASLVRLPSETVLAKKLERNVQKTKPAPKIAEGHDFILGKNIHQGVERFPTLNQSQKLKHMHVIGATGTGKSTFLQSCIVQDIMLGNGVAVLDPHGDLIEAILPYIPEHRLQDVIIIDPSDTEFPIGFNILTAHSDIEKEILASDLVAVFKRLSTSWGDQMHSVLANALLAFVESTQGGTLIDLRRFLIEKPYREEFLQTVTDPSIIYYWQKEYPLLKSNSIGSILTRLDSFLRPKAIRYMVAQKKSLDFGHILNSQKIVLVKLSEGLIGRENSYLLGTFIVSKIYQAAMSRQLQAKDERKAFYLYIDEFQNFITPSMNSILSGTRKYGLGCVLAHQDMIQLQKEDTELASMVISNAGTRICFRVGDIDAKRLESGFSAFEASDLQNLGVGQAIIRIERPEFDCNISTLELKELPREIKETIVNAAIAISREKYGTPKEEVERPFEYLRVEQTKQSVEKAHVVDVPSKELQEQPKEEKVQIQKAPIVPKKELVVPVEIQDTTTKAQLVKQKEITEHRYIQTLIKKMAEARGYKATIEELTPDGKGRVDVSLERNGKKIACEIGVTTTKDWEVHNIEKCLAAGYDIIFAIAKNAKSVMAMQQKISETIGEAVQKKILVFETEGLSLYLDKEIAKEATSEKRVKGYRVKVEYDAVSEQEMQVKRTGIVEAITRTKNIKFTNE